MPDRLDPERALLRAVALALTGEDPGEAAGEVSVADPTAVVYALAAAGWPASRVQELRRGCQAEERPWPFVPPRELCAAAGFARYGALLKQARRELGVDGLVSAVHQGPKVLGPAERRLMAEVPPHHGTVG